MTRLTRPKNLNAWNDLGKVYLPGHMGLEILSVEAGELRARMKIQQKLCAPNGFLHAASIVALADTTCGYATVNNLPQGADGFTTIELKTNFIGTTLEGAVLCVAKPVHIGRTTQVWDAEVSVEQTGRKIAFFRCTQMILWPKDEHVRQARLTEGDRQSGVHGLRLRPDLSDECAALDIRRRHEGDA